MSTWDSMTPEEENRLAERMRAAHRELTWKELEDYRIRIEMAESITLMRDTFLRILDFIDTQEARAQIIAGHRDDYKKELRAALAELRSLGAE